MKLNWGYLKKKREVVPSIILIILLKINSNFLVNLLSGDLPQTENITKNYNCNNYHK